MGLTHGTIAGMLLTDLILGRPNPWTKLYSPSRVPLKAANDLVREDLNMAAQYADWVTPGDVRTFNDIAPDSGAIVRQGLELKKIGNEILEVLGGRAIHPVNVCVGGFYRAPSRRELYAEVLRARESG
jgi:coenzyme F420-reducing hydrogenase alpha subunit